MNNYLQHGVNFVILCNRISRFNSFTENAFTLHSASITANSAKAKIFFKARKIKT